MNEVLTEFVVNAKHKYCTHVRIRVHGLFIPAMDVWSPTINWADSTTSRSHVYQFPVCDNLSGTYARIIAEINQEFRRPNETAADAELIYGGGNRSTERELRKVRRNTYFTETFQVNVVRNESGVGVEK